MKTGRLVVLLFLFAASLVLFLKEALSAALFMGGLWLLVTLTFVVAERAIASRLGITMKMLNELEFQIFLPPKTGNALYLSPFLRIIPILLALLASLLFALLPESTDDQTLPLLSCLCAALVSGVSIAAPIAALTASETLRRKDIHVSARGHLRMARLARVRTLLADQSLFYGSRNAELRGFYANGVLHPVADLNFDEYLSLVLGFCHCDDGSLAAAFGFRQPLTDVLLRAMRTTPMEHRVLLAPPAAAFTPYDAEVGYVCAELTFADGREVSYRTGKPEALLPQVTRIFDRGFPRPAEPADLKRLQSVLQNIYEIGRQAIALTQAASDGSLTFIGYLFVTSAPIAGAEAAVSTLRKSGVNIVYVSREHESCAFYRASSLGITADASRIMTGARIENFRPESLQRAIPRARIAAEMRTEQRAALVAALRERDETLAAASDDPNDGLFCGADVTISASSERTAADYTVKHCRITDVAEIFRTVREACDAAVRSMIFAVSVPFAVALFLLLTAFFAPIPPFAAPVAAFLSFFLPVPFSLAIAARSAARSAAQEPLLGIADKPAHKPLRKKPAGSFYLVWQLAAAAISAAFAANLYRRLEPVSAAGIPAASAAACLTLLVAALVSAAIAYSWGSSLFTLLERKNRIMPWLMAGFAAVGFVALRFEPVNALLGFEAVAFRHLPQTVIPGLAAALVYELGLLLARVIARRSR